MASTTSRRLQFGVAVVDGRLYVVGGRDGLKTLNTVECYDIKSKSWTTLPPMSTHRHGLGNYFLHLFAVMENGSDNKALIQLVPYSTSTHSVVSDCHNNYMSHTSHILHTFTADKVLCIFIARVCVCVHAWVHMGCEGKGKLKQV